MNFCHCVCEFSCSIASFNFGVKKWKIQIESNKIIFWVQIRMRLQKIYAFSISTVVFSSILNLVFVRHVIMHEKLLALHEHDYDYKYGNWIYKFVFYFFCLHLFCLFLQSAMNVSMYLFISLRIKKKWKWKWTTKTMLVANCDHSMMIM